MKRCGILIAWLTLVFPAQAAARYPGERPATEPEIAAMLRTADTHWAAKGLPGPLPTVLIADSLCDSDGWCPEGRGDHISQTIWLLNARTAATLTASNEWLRATRLRADCAAVTHELGHVRGLDHVTDPTNIMYSGAPMWIDVPECATAFPDPWTLRCAPGWSRVTRRTRHLWRAAHRHAARRTFRRWAKRHPVRAERARDIGEVCF